MFFIKYSLIYAIVTLTTLINELTGYKVIYAINAGGEQHYDAYNDIKYERDPLVSVGTASDYGKQIRNIGRIDYQTDEILYQTERYHTDTFGYDIPLDGDGDYALALKFCEVYFTAANMKVFDVVVNDEHTVLNDLDIYHQVGKGVAHDELIYFTVSRGRMFLGGEESDVRGGRIKVEFIKGYRDNPKINAIVLFKGKDLHRIPKLPPQIHEIDDTITTGSDSNINSNNINNNNNNDAELFDEIIPNSPSSLNDLSIEEKILNQQLPPTAQNYGGNGGGGGGSNSKSRRTSGPKQEDPYSMEDSSVMLPVFIAIGAFIPLLFCLCKL